MLSMLTGQADMGRRLGAAEVEVMEGLMKNTTSWMSQPQMPQVDGGRGSNKSLRRRRRRQRVQVAGAITSEEHRPSRQILDGKTEWIKLNSHIVVSCKRSNRNKILNERRRDEDVVKKRRGLGSGNRCRSPVSNR